jgi:hypothetical protein
MKRRDFIQKSSCCASVGVLASTALLGQNQSEGEQNSPKPKKYQIQIEIYEARKDTWCHKKGDKFNYPQDIGKICPWLLSSMHDFIIDCW